ncbi:MAG: 3-hydroxyacyl-ACP dehydratase [Crocinitomicaceae bacterium]|nr:3-hydroxyacyl-ACP dehydratase [Crocinitomicaceae bacterium]
MLFKNEFYKVNASNTLEQTTTFSIEIDKDHDIFKGHFPDNPVTPGVVQMEIIKELVSETKNTEAKLISMGNCKFLAVLNPNENPLLDVVLKINETEENQLKVSAVIKTEETSFLKMSAFYSID